MSDHLVRLRMDDALFDTLNASAAAAGQSLAAHCRDLLAAGATPSTDKEAHVPEPDVTGEERAKINIWLRDTGMVYPADESRNWRSLRRWARANGCSV